MAKRQKRTAKKTSDKGRVLHKKRKLKMRGGVWPNAGSRGFGRVFDKVFRGVFQGLINGGVKASKIMKARYKK